MEEPSEVIQGRMDVVCEDNTAACSLRQRLLHVAKKMTRARHCKLHQTQLTKNLVPFLQTGLLLSGEDAGKDLGEARDPALR